MKLQVIDINEGTSVDGPGLRTSIYFAGCNHHCPGCHNPQSWDFKAGKEVTEEELLKVIEYNDFNVTFSGGDPFMQADKVAHLARRIHQEQHKTIWCYTGYTWEEVLRHPEFRELLENIDVLVDSPFLLAQRDISLLFRGSSNQRIIDVKTSLQTGKLTTLEY